MSTIEINTQSGERVSFYKLFHKKGYNIEIPIIQRDYAQGRISTQEVREMFLDALLEYLEQNIPNRDLDFVYGSLITNGTTNFIPLDGQQRLTTLFLLHWYLANISGNTDLLKKVMTVNGKSKFTYETRTSSSEFCDALMSNEIDINKLLAPDKGQKNSLSKTIKNFGWYYLSWKFDPTIQSMLTMLDALHTKFVNKPEFFDRLINTENPIITFLFLNLKDFKLTDDLYIKMNSRGKPLTPFENFKAKFEQHVSEIEPNNIRQFKLKFGDTVKTVSFKEYFSHKIDTEWANLFWNYRTLINRSRDKKQIDNTFDDELMNFIRVIVSNQYAIDSKNDKDEKLEILFDTQIGRKLEGKLDVISYHKYMTLNVLSDKSIYYLVDALDKLTNGENKIKLYLPDTFYFDENKVFENVLLHDNLTLLQRVQFHAYVRYLICNGNNSEGIDQWMRVIHNLAQNTVIDGADEVARAIKSIEKLIHGSADILSLLKTNSRIEFFTGRQVQEEKIKAYLITKLTSNDWKSQIEVIEKHEYLAGQIGFIFEFSGILEYFEAYSNCDWSEEQDNEFFRSFVDYSNKSNVVFKAIGTTDNKDFPWERAVLSKGDYLLWTTSRRRNLLSTNRNLRDFSWKRLLRLTPIGTEINDANNWKTNRSYVKAVFDDNLFDGNNLFKSLEKICKTTDKDWRRYFIENPELIRYCEQGFIRFESEDKIYLFKASQQNHKHREMYSYNFYLKWLADISDLLPFKNAYHYEIKSSDDYSCAVIYNWTFNRKKYAIDIYYDNSNKEFLPNPFEIKFYKQEGNKNRVDYHADIIEILESQDFEWKEDNHGFWLSAKDENKTYSALLELCGKLYTL
jgi:hypothetical protein